MRRAKIEFVQRLAARAILMLHETRAISSGLHHRMRSVEATHGSRRLASRSFCKQAPCIVEMVRRRVLQVHGARCGWSRRGYDELCAQLRIWNQDMKTAAMVLHSPAAEHSQDPYGRMAVLIRDANSVATAAGVGGVARPRPDRILASALSWCVELLVSGATHIDASTASFGAIDGVWALVPRSLLGVVRPTARVGAQSERAHADGLSNHAFVVVEWPQRRSLSVERLPVLHAVAEDE